MKTVRLTLFKLLMTFGALAMAAGASAKEAPLRNNDPRPYYESTLAKILEFVTPPRIDLDLSFSVDSEKQVELRQASGEVVTKMTADINVPLADAIEDAKGNQFIPTLHALSKGIEFHWVAKGARVEQGLASQLTFQRDGKVVPLVLTIKSPMTNYLLLRIHSIDFLADGLSSAPGKARLTGSCDLQQNTLSLTTGRVKWQEIECTFEGTYDKDQGKYRFDLDVQEGIMP